MFLVSCSDEVLERTPNSENNTLSALTTTLPEVEVVTVESQTVSQMLKFQTVEDYDAAIEHLDLAIDAAEAKFIAEAEAVLGAGMTEDQLNAHEENIGYNDQLELVNFESTYGIHSSMRTAYNSAEIAWLDQDMPESSDPNIAYPFPISEMALLTPGGEVMIGDAIMKQTSNGVYWIPDGNLQVLDAINLGQESSLEQGSFEYYGKSAAPKMCDGWEISRYQTLSGPDDKYKYKEYIAHRRYPWKAVQNATIIGYRKRNSGKYRRFRSRIGVSLQTYMYDSDCSYLAAQEYDTQSTRWRRYRNVYNARWGFLIGYKATLYQKSYGIYRNPHTASSTRFLQW